MFNILHTFQPQAVLFHWGFVTIYWYGLFIVSGIVAGLFVALRLAKAQGINSDQVYDLAFYAIVASLVGARLYAVMLDIPYYSQHPLEVFAVWQGGLAIHGAIIAAVFILLWYSWKKNLHFLKLADLAAVVLPVGQAIGRFGNYFNQELFGTPTSLPWGIPIALRNRPLQYISEQYFHPTFLYESILNFINFGVLLLLYKKIKLQPGIIFCVYLINYSIIRILMEQLRTDVTPELFGLRLPVAVSMAIIAASVIGIVALKNGLTLPKR